MSATPDPEHLHVGPEEQDQNAGNIHDRVPEGLDVQGRARDTSEKIEVVPAHQGINLYATHVNASMAARVPEKAVLASTVASLGPGHSSHIYKPF